MTSPILYEINKYIKQFDDVKTSKKINWITNFFYNFSFVVSHKI